MREYHRLLEHVLDRGELVQNRTGVPTLSVFGAMFSHNLRDGFPLLTTKKLPWRWIAEELAWFLSGSTNEEDLSSKGVDIWKEWAKDDGSLGPVYGHMWRNFGGDWTTGHGGHDQVETLLDTLLKDQTSRRNIVTAWHPVQSPQAALPACHTLFQVKVNNNTLHLGMFQRSADIFLGVPFNIASYALLAHLLCKVGNFVPGNLAIFFGDLHLYTNHVDQARTQLSRVPRSLPMLILNTLPGKDAVLKFSSEQAQMQYYHPYPAIKADVAV
jgi:thymidylate synthase